jgi:hypothetical protein
VLAVNITSGILKFKETTGSAVLLKPCMNLNSQHILPRKPDPEILDAACTIDVPLCGLRSMFGEQVLLNGLPNT